MSTSQHTPLPWSATADGLIQGGQYNTPIARIGSFSLMVGSAMERNANIDFIIHACNNHAALVNALKEASARFDKLYTECDKHMAAAEGYSACEAALKLAKG